MSAPADVIIGHFGAEPDHPNKKEKVRYTISSEVKNKGKSATKDFLGIELTDTQFAQAEVIAAAAALPAFSLPCPPIGYQGDEGSCGPFAVAYNALSIEWYIKMGSTSFDRGVNTFSPEYVWDQVKTGSCTTGSSLLANFDFIKNNGDVLWNTLPYVWADGVCSHSPSAPEQAEAAQYRIGDYSFVLNNDVAAIKAILQAGHAVVFYMNFDSAWYQCGPGFVLSASTASGINYGPHFMPIVGWDDSKNAWKCANSFGTSWGDAGFGYVDYNYFPIVTSSQSIYISSMVPNVPPANQPPVANAGADQTVPTSSTVVLDGSASHDPDGYIASYLWEKVSGPSSPAIVNSTSAVASIVPAVAGTYVYKLTVTDNATSPLSAFDTVTITVNAAVVDTLSLTVSKVVSKGKTVDVLTWNIVLANPPISAELQLGTSSSSFGTLYPIVPYTPTGTYSYTVSNKRIYRFYRLKVIKSDGSVVYQISSPESIK